MVEPWVFRSGKNIGFSQDLQGEAGVFGAGSVPQASIPNAVRFTLPAGSCVCFDTATWHTSLPNLITERCDF
jgi:hypothetical protein